MILARQEEDAAGNLVDRGVQRGLDLGDGEGHGRQGSQSYVVRVAELLPWPAPSGLCRQMC